MSRGERKMMIRRDCPYLSLSRQCHLLSISRSNVGSYIWWRLWIGRRVMDGFGHVRQGGVILRMA